MGTALTMLRQALAFAFGPTVRSRVLEIACLACIAFLLLMIVSFGYGRDQGIYAMVARSIVAGRMPYRDAWDFKPPGVFLVYAATRALFGSSQTGIRIVEAAGLAAMVAAMMRITREWWGERTIGLVAGVVAVLIHAQLDFWHTAQPESFGGMVTIFALAALGPMMGAPPAGARGEPEDGAASERGGLDLTTRDATRRLLIAGALFGFAGLLKPPLAGGGAVVAAALGLRIARARGDFSRETIVAALRPAGLVLAGGASPFVLCLVWFAIRGALHDLYYVLFVFTPYYTKLSWVDRTIPGMAYEGFMEWLTTYSSVVTAGVLLGLAYPRSPRERFGVRVICAIIAVHIAGVVMQAKFFPYHWGATWPLTALLVARGFHRLWEQIGRAGPAGMAAFFVGAAYLVTFRTATQDVEGGFFDRCAARIAILKHTPRDQKALDRLASVADVNAVANREVAEFLRARVPADRNVFVWGFEPVIYDLADRTAATRYIYDVPQRVAWAKARERDVLMRDLDAGRPAAIVVERRDVFPMVTGDAIDSADTLRDFPALAGLIADRYTHAATIEDFEVYLEQPR